MAENTKIEWCDHTFNPWIGCTKVAPGCTYCYAESFAKRYNKAAWGPHGTRVKTSESYWKQPLKWNKAAEKAGERHRVFCASLADVFEEWSGTIASYRGNALKMADIRHDLFALIDATPHIDWLLLTKRPENVLAMWRQTPTCKPYHLMQEPAEVMRDCFYRPNVWLGCSVSEQKTADENIPKLLECRDLCPVLFLSCEPLLGPINLDAWLVQQGPSWQYASGDDSSGRPGIDWVIVGGESGHGARPCNVEWIRSIRDQCQAAKVPRFVKQLGSRIFIDRTGRDIYDDSTYHKVKDSKGGDPSEWPPDLRVREFPSKVPASNLD